VSVVETDARPRRLGNFELLEEIGQGGMGVVYRARQPSLERFVVLKKIRRELLAQPTMLGRFEREARAAAAVHHQNVVAVYDCFEARGDHYIAQELVDGTDLRAILAKLGRLEPGVGSLIALEIARGLEEIHARGIVHRDLKPANILIGSGGEVKIADFGIAIEATADGLTRPGTMIGSIPYMAPEQILGQRADARTDVFLFGILLYEMLAGAPPYRAGEGDEAESLLERMRKERYTPLRRLAPRAPSAVARLVRQGLRARPARRIATATDLRIVLERALGRPSALESRAEVAAYLWNRGVFRAEQGTTEVRAPARRRHRVALRGMFRAAIAGMLAALVLVVGVAGYKRHLKKVGKRDEVAAAPRPVTPEVTAAVPLPLALPVAAPAPAPAQVRFVAVPWAEVQVDDKPGFLTPQAAPVSLPPGQHRIAFTHPRFGRAEIVVDLSPAEARTIRHAFTPEATP
jgi:eukaryotic-like serine/threonine-protein kinase